MATYLNVLYIFIVKSAIMAIKRKVRIVGESLAVTILSQIAQLHDIKEEDYLELFPSAMEKLR